MRLTMAFGGLTQLYNDDFKIPKITRGRQIPIRTGVKIGRNEPCPCGSGKKYKKCCALANER